MHNKSNTTDPVGRWVMVHPELNVDKACMQGEVGKVIKRISDDAVTAQFDQDIKANYLNDALVTLDTSVAILSRLQQNMETLKRVEQKKILEIVKLMITSRWKDALKMAMTEATEPASSICTMTLQEWIDDRKIRKDLKNSVGKKL